MNTKDVLGIRTGATSQTIVFYTNGETMLEIANDGFWVRGVKVDQDAREARQVYECFTQWLALQQLMR
jgi:hypothetical protein